MRNRKFLAVLAAMGLAFLAIAGGGGCGGSSHSGSISPNSAFNGVWQSSGGTATLSVNGQTFSNLSVNLAFLGADCDVEKDAGSMTATILVILTSESGAKLPMICDEMKFTTTRLDTEEWTASSTSPGTVTLGLELDSNTRATLTEGTFEPAGDLKLTLSDVTLTKQTTPSQTLDVDTVMNGAWMTEKGNGGGFVDVDNNGTHSYFLASRDYSVSGGLSFSNTSLAGGTTTFKGGLSMAAANTATGASATFPFVFDSAAENTPVKLEHLFGNAYRATISSNGIDVVKGYFMFRSENEADFLTNILLTPNTSNWAMLSAAATLTKSSASSSGDISRLVGKTYEISGATGFAGATTGTASGTTGLITIADGGTMAVSAAQAGQVTVDLNMSVTQTTDAAGSTGTWLFQKTAPLTVEAIGGNMFLGTASSDEMAGMILVLPADAELTQAYSVANLWDKTSKSQLAVGGRLILKQ
ncbi:MAG: hypothetical protein IJU98_10990 [Synergistaceae bacterium]|nr:hypothetical protein [Synergistaceae bacterium]